MSEIKSEETLRKHVGERVAYFRKCKGKTRKEFAEELKIPTTKLIRIETGKNLLDYSLIFVLMDMFNITFPDFFNDKEILLGEMTTFGKLRNERNLSLQKVSKTIGCTLDRLIKLERGYAEPTLNELIKYSDTFKVSIDALLDRDKKN